MRISLIYPLLPERRSLIDENKQFWPPLGLAYIAAVLEKENHKVQVIDRDILLRKSGMDFGKTDNATLDLIKNFRTDIVGISATTPNMPDVSHISRYIKNNYDKAAIIIGGPHPSGEPVLSLEESEAVDAVGIGEGEFIMRDLANGLALDRIEGIAYRSGNRISLNPPRPPIQNIDDIPLPARHLLDMKFYTRPSRYTSRNLSLRTTSIFTARGCPYRCNFCAGPLVFGGKVRFHSPGRVLDEIDELITRYAIEALYFAEDMFLSSRKRAEELLNLFIKNGIPRRIKWFAQAKANIITAELLELMKKAGCVSVEYGFESGSQRVLDLMNKKLKVEDSICAAALTRRAGLRFQANIIVGYPGEREDDFAKTIEFIKKIRPSMIGFNIFMPLPGTPSYEQLKEEGKKLPSWGDIGDPEKPEANFADMPKETFERLYLKARLSVILPINLRNFITDNIKNPIRLIKVGLTQFRGVLIKTFRTVYRLSSLSKECKDTTNILFISYNGILEPILPSQAVPYLKRLADKNFKFVLLTYEKKHDLIRAGNDGVAQLKSDLKDHGIEWIYLKYHKNPPILSTLFDLCVGMARALFLIYTKKIKIVHIRGITPGSMMFVLSKIVNVKLLFDMRGLLAEEYVGGGIWREEGVPFRLVKKAERKMLNMSDAVVVLTKKHLELNRSLDYLKNRKIPMDVVPCCVDMELFDYRGKDESDLRNRLGLAGKFIVAYPGKIGTFYLMDEMLYFFKALAGMLPDAVFLIISRDDIAPVLKKASEIGIDKERMRFVKDIPFEEMPRYMRIADAGIFFINPYKKIGSSPIKMGEFLASGVPVIINPGVGDTEELVRHNKVGVVVPDFGELAYKKSVEELLLLKRDGDELKKRCRDTAARYLSVDTGVDKYAALYNAILEGVE